MYSMPPFMYPNPLWFPYLPHDLDVPPTLYSLMNSIVNYGKPDKTKIKDLASASRETIFDFDYPLSDKVDKAKFETNILNHFLHRRIGYDTFTMFQIELNSKLNEIMPKYNILFDSTANWDLFKNGLTIEKIGHVEDTKHESGTNDSETSAEILTNSNTKMRHSDLPQSELQDINDEQYVNIYENNDTTNNSNSTSSNKQKTNSNENKNNDYTETVKHSQQDLTKLYIEFQTQVNSIYTLIYRELDSLFYGLV